MAGRCREASAAGTRRLSNAFELCKGILALDVARHEGIALQQKGDKWWACCPLHNERTASLAFFPDGGWHCFGCNQGGDAVAFYAALHDLKPLEAARGLLQALNPAAAGGPARVYRPKGPSKAQRLQQGVDAWYRRKWDAACSVKHRASALILGEEERQDQLRVSPDGVPRDYVYPEAFWKLIAARAAADQRLEDLQGMDAGDRVGAVKEELQNGSRP